MPNLLRRGLVAALAATAAVPVPAFADRTVHVDSAGLFDTPTLHLANGETVEWTGLRPGDAIVELGPQVFVDLAGGAAAVDTHAICADSHTGLPNRYTRAFTGAADELTGPDRHGASGIWALGPEGGTLSDVEVPSPEATALGLTSTTSCDAADSDRVILADDPLTPAVNDRVRYVYDWEPAANTSGDAGAVPAPAQVTELFGAHAQHLLCTVHTWRCVGAGTTVDLPPNPPGCTHLISDPADPPSIAPGTHLNRLLPSTYANPDVAGVVLRFNWKDLQYDDHGTITERWTDLDHELEAAIAHGKLVTLDVRAGMFGTPPWIFAGYTPSSGTWVRAPAGAGLVTPLTFTDYYTRGDASTSCGDKFTIGSPGDPSYVALYTDFIDRLARHVASDTRWFAAVAHVKISGANLRTSEAELPHHCDDGYTNTGEAYAGSALPYLNPGGDGVLDAFKTLITLPGGATYRATNACECNPEIWWRSGYEPAQLYAYYAAVEQQIVDSFFGRKSMGYQIIQDGFPRADAADRFHGDHLYRETLVASTAGSGLPAPASCNHDGIVQPRELCDDGNLIDTDGCRNDCMPPERVNQSFRDHVSCATPDGPATPLMQVDEDRTTPAVSYCSRDQATWSLPGYLDLRVTPIEPISPGSPLAYETADDTGAHYPAGAEQAEHVLDDAGDGRFSTPTGALDRASGTLFVPQHSGLQPLPQERVALQYTADPAAPVAACHQQVGRSTVPVVAGPASPAALVGPYIATFGFFTLGDHFGDVSELGDPDTAGCPNAWIVKEGSRYDFVNAPGFPFPVPAPPQLIGWQTTNDVRAPEHVESALMNLVYNTNGVFIELYEDAIWRIANTAGTGSTALPIDAAATAHSRIAGCDPATTFHCYTKNLWQWGNELHARRAMFTAMFDLWFPGAHPGYALPFPSTYRHTFHNSTGLPQAFAYINPAACVYDRVFGGGGGALGTILVDP